VAPATYLGLDEDLGGIAAGRRADIVVLDDFREPRPSAVLTGGRIAVEDGVCTAPFPEIAWPEIIPRRFGPVWPPAPELFEMTAAGAPADPAAVDPVSFPAIVLENSVITRRRDVPMMVRGGRLQPPPSLVRLALVDPRGRWIVRGALDNFVHRLDGLASTFNVTAQLVVLGQRTEDMALAARRVLDLGGGIVAVEDGRTVLELPLPIGGVMAPDRLPVIAERAGGLYAFLRARGYPHTDPYYTLLFLTLDSLPDVRVTYRGVWDARRNRVLVPRQDL
jgi:adenine deaminase